MNRVSTIKLALLCLLLWSVGIAHAQDHPTPYEIALERIQEAQANGTTILNLSNERLTVLPPEIGNLTQLQELELAHNELTTLPPEIGNLDSLIYLGVYSNELTTLPPEIGDLDSLLMLYLDENKLTSLPPEIANLSTLEFLWVGGNPLRAVPYELGNLPQLQELRITGSWLEFPPPEVVARGQEATIAFLRRPTMPYSPYEFTPTIIIVAGVSIISWCGAVALLLCYLRWRGSGR